MSPGDAANGNGKPADDAEIETFVEVADNLTSQSRHSLRLSGSPPSGQLLIPLERSAGGLLTLLRIPRSLLFRVPFGAVLRDAHLRHGCASDDLAGDTRNRARVLDEHIL